MMMWCEHSSQRSWWMVGCFFKPQSMIHNLVSLFSPLSLIIASIKKECLGWKDYPSMWVLLALTISFNLILLCTGISDGMASWKQGLITWQSNAAELNWFPNLIITPQFKSRGLIESSILDQSLILWVSFLSSFMRGICVTLSVAHSTQIIRENYIILSKLL